MTIITDDLKILNFTSGSATANNLLPQLERIWTETMESGGDDEEGDRGSGRISAATLDLPCYQKCMDDGGSHGSCLYQCLS